MPESITIGNITVEKGEFGKGVIKGVELVDSSSIDIPVMVLKGEGDGPTLLLMSTQHGARAQARVPRGPGALHVRDCRARAVKIEKV